MVKFLKAKFHGDSNIGLYAFATDSYCLLGIDLPLKLNNKIFDILKVNIKNIRIAGTEFVGMFAAGNGNGIVLPKTVEKNEIKALRKLGLNISVLKSKETTIGNLVLCNDSGCIISERLKGFKKEIRDCLGCEVEAGSVANLGLVGSGAIANNSGCLCHRDAKEEEIEKIESILKVKADIGSIGGSPFVKAGLIVNGNGVIASERSTGPELDRAFETFEVKIL